MTRLQPQSDPSRHKQARSSTPISLNPAPYPPLNNRNFLHPLTAAVNHYACQEPISRQPVKFETQIGVVCPQTEFAPNPVTIGGDRRRPRPPTSGRPRRSPYSTSPDCATSWGTSGRCVSALIFHSLSKGLRHCSTRSVSTREFATSYGPGSLRASTRSSMI